MKKIDIHIHSVEQNIVFGDKRIPTPEDFEQHIFKQENTEKGLLLPLTNIINDDSFSLEEKIDQGNMIAYQLTQKYPHCLDWYCYMDPRMGGNRADADLSHWLSRYKALGAKGVGELSTSLYFDDPLYDNLFAHCERYELPVLFHISPDPSKYYGIADDPGLPRMEKMLQKYPNLIFIGHSQPFWAEISADISPYAEARNGYPTGKVLNIVS